MFQSVFFNYLQLTHPVNPNVCHGLFASNLDERVSKSLRWGNPLFRIQLQTPTQKVHKRIQQGLLRIRNSAPTTPHYACLQLCDRPLKIILFDDVLSRHRIDFLGHKDEILIKMHRRVLAPSEEFCGEASATFNHETEHLIVCSAGEEDFSGVQFEEGAAY